eukprot:191272-Amphidinium_carterae.1
MRDTSSCPFPAKTAYRCDQSSFYSLHVAQAMARDWPSCLSWYGLLHLLANEPSLSLDALEMRTFTWHCVSAAHMLCHSNADAGVLHAVPHEELEVGGSFLAFQSNLPML